MSPLIYLLVAIGILALLYVAFRKPLRAFLKFRGAMVVTCPENSKPAGVKVDAGHAALTGVAGEPDFRLEYCSRWPERQDCGRACLKQIESAPEDCLVRNILTHWYQDKSCAYCGQQLGEINWVERRPALMSPEGKTVEWRDLLPEAVPPALATHKPVCWDCHIAETFRREHPELVVDRNFKRAATSK